MQSNTSFNTSISMVRDGNTTVIIQDVSLQRLQKAYHIILPILLAIIMLATGSSITWDTVKTHLCRPLGILTGLLTQSLLFPLVAFGLAHAVNTSPEKAIGILFLACTPIAGVSNVFTRWAKGDVSLSACTTILSYPLSMGTIPLNLLIYSKSWTEESTSVPYTGILIGLATLAIPLSIGMLLRWKFIKVVPYTTKIGSVAGCLIPVVAITSGAFLYPWVFRSPITFWISAAALPFCGFILGLMTSCMTRLKLECKRTIVFTTPSVNVGLCLTLIELTFPQKTRSKVTTFPLLYMLFWYVDVFVVIIILKLYYKCCAKTTLIISRPDESVNKENVGKEGQIDNSTSFNTL